MDREFLDKLEQGSAAARERALATGEPHEDMLFTLPLGGESQVVKSIGEVNEAGEVMPFVCMPCSFGPSAVPNSHVMECDGCRTEVWMSPATKETFDKFAKKLILCMTCMVKRIKSEKGEVADAEGGG